MRKVIDMYDRLESEYQVKRVLSSSFPGYERAMSLSDGEALRAFLRGYNNASESKDELFGDTMSKEELEQMRTVV